MKVTFFPIFVSFISLSLKTNRALGYDYFFNFGFTNINTITQIARDNLSYYLVMLFV